MERETENPARAAWGKAHSLQCAFEDWLSSVQHSQTAHIVDRQVFKLAMRTVIADLKEIKKNLRDVLGE